jgi:hypothetical protein
MIAEVRFFYGNLVVILVPITSVLPGILEFRINMM